MMVDPGPAGWLMLLSPIASLHLPSPEPLDLGLSLGNSPERSKIDVFVAPGCAYTESA